VEKDRSSILQRILGSPVYVQEKYDHDHYCDGEGEITEYSMFYPFQSRSRPCRFCERLTKQKAPHDKVDDGGETA
jgi:hypothetical protein